MVRRLLARQFPAWADLPLAALEHSGTDNAIFRLGDALAVRLPRVEWAAGQAEKEHRWLPELAPRLPLEVPLPLGLGEPQDGYPWRWTVCRWIEGQPLPAVLLDDAGVAEDLARFVTALQAIAPGEGPRPGQHNFYRGVPLARRDRVTREAIAQLGDEFDLARLTDAWDAVLALPPHDGAPVWLHGDLHEGNLLGRDGRLAAAIDFGGLGVGDPACDFMAAWMIFAPPARAVFRRAVAADDPAWARARGWALSVSLVQLPFYRQNDPHVADLARRTLREVLADDSCG